ncbi:hypothetical protein E3N88_08924 [Mikania micrantha]|uniref:Sodium channel modifier 1 acidic C-terminal domain-containing protein n=1 Tax=Mikania micrantha TaxID=192012 RepID=A0A5N6PIL5_9ASTR|nr:hypothetical protein E3N88_08924 [Mikania micrantha]
MSVFGGDSWGREAQHRKRRVDDLLLDTAGDHSSYRKLSTGKYACVVCPHNPVLDTPVMLSRIALSLDSTAINKTGYKSTKQANLASKPLTEETPKTAFEVPHHSYPEQDNDQSRCPISENEGYDLTNATFVQMETRGKDVLKLPLDYRERRERELKFTAAGWKRDGHGGWFRDENVEFDSDEEDPNECLANDK